ncbi:MAG TPA: DUF2520 domain-containing protein [Chitinophagaceae bacterium]|nr:DUF2520 domain-containing protein [Chitinophagaceae bacterium]
MNIVIIGSGNVAAVLGRKCYAAGHRIVQVWGRNASAASELAYEWDTESTNYLSLINPDADVYLLAVSDDAISTLAAELRLPGRVVAHTAASVPASVLSKVTQHYGVLYPLQSLRKEKDTLPEIPLYVDGHDEKAKTLLRRLANSVAPGKVGSANDDERLRLHVAAVLVSNFVNHLYALAADYCKKEGLDFEQLHPLIQETAMRITDISPAAAQTGPAVRHDEETIARHLAALVDYPALQQLYTVLTRSIQQVR